ncbi:MAG: sugar ABC transporter substrate-binding protein [Chloroflexi bacterium]|nr:sugar ABC transporter substrate-binding protein [Chloroflexota bacterium]
MSNLSRRDFLKGLAASGAALGAQAAGGLLPFMPTAAAQDVAQVTYATPGGVVEDAAWEPVWEAFNEENDDIQANYLAVGGGYGPQYLQLLQARLAAGTGPDVFFVMDGFMVGFAARGVLVPIDSFIEASPDVDLEDNYAGHIEAHRWQDQLWGLPRDGAPYATWFNADIYDEAGIDYPQALSWEEFVAQAVELTERDERGRATVIGAGRGAWIDWIWQAGGDVLNEEGTECLMGEPEAIDGLRFAQSLVVEHQCSPSASDLADQNEGALFTSGRMASFTVARGFLGAVCNADFRFDAALPPAGKVRVGRTNVGPTVMSAETPDKSAAWELLKFINSSRGQTLKISTGYAYPSRRSVVQEDWYVNFTCGQAIGTGLNTVFNDIMENNWARTWPKHPQWPEVSTVINSELDALYSGDKSAEDVGTDIAAQVNAILSAE